MTSLQGAELSRMTSRPATVVRDKLSEQIADHLRDEIVHQILAPGTLLVQRELCERFGTSRMPVRDALQRLTHEGLLVDRGNHKQVAELGTTDIGDVVTLIAVLHGWAGSRTTEQARPSDLAELKLLLDEMRQRVPPLRFSVVAREFHRKINLFSRSSVLIRTITELQQSVPRVFPMTVSPEGQQHLLREYEKTMQAMENGDPATVERLLREVVLNVTIVLVSNLQGMADGGPAG